MNVRRLCVIVQFENKVTQSAAILLDLGGGISGPACDWLANDPLLQVDSITISSVQNRIAEARIAKRDLSARARSILGDYHNLTSLVSSNAYDAAIAMETLGYSHNLTAVFEGVYRSLKPGGRFFLKEVCRPTMEFSQDEQKALDDVATVYGGMYAAATPCTGRGASAHKPTLGCLVQSGSANSRQV